MTSALTAIAIRELRLLFSVIDDEQASATQEEEASTNTNSNHDTRRHACQGVLGGRTCPAIQRCGDINLVSCE